MRRKGLPSSEKLLRVGKATLLHQHSSRKPTAQVSGLALGHFHQPVAPPFLFSLWGSGEVIHRLARLPCHPEKARQGAPYGLVRDPHCV